MNYFELNDDNIVNFAMKNYDNPSCKNIEEFQEDFNRIKYIKRLFNRIDENHFPILKTFLTYLNYCPEENLDGINIIAIPLDQKIVQQLRSLK